MSELKKKLLAAAIILMLLLSNVWMIKNNIQDRKENKIRDRAISSLSDSIRVSRDSFSTTFKKYATQINIKDLTNSPEFKLLSANQQKFFNELKDVKGLVSATQTTLNKQGSIINDLYIQGAQVTDSTITFKRKTQLVFCDTTKMFKWNEKLTIDNPISRTFNYSYKPTITVTYQKLKNKNIEVKWNINDPDITMNELNNYIIPFDYKAKTQFGKWVEKNKTIFSIIGGVGLFGAGVYTGVTVLK